MNYLIRKASLQKFMSLMMQRRNKLKTSLNKREKVRKKLRNKIKNKIYRL